MSEIDSHISETGTMVVDPRGRIGMICNVYPRKVRIQLGQGGPHAVYYKGALRVATVGEIEDAGLKGVGRSWPPE